MAEEKTSSPEINKEEALEAWLKVKKNGEYPAAHRDEKKVDTYKNSKDEKVLVNDPYHWLEDPDSKETRAWVNEQVKVTTGYLNECENKEAIHKRIKGMMNYPRIGCPIKREAIIIIDITQDYKIRTVYIFIVTLLLDPNEWSEDGTSSLGGTYSSDDGELMAYSIKHSGSDWNEFKIKHMLTGKDSKETLKWCKFTGISWTPDNAGFFYSRYEPPQKHKELDPNGTQGTETEKLSNQMLYYHVVGTEQSEDVFLLDARSCGDAEWFISPHVSDDGKWLLIFLSPNCDPVNRLYLVKLQDLDLKSGSNQSNAHLTLKKVMIKLIDNFDNGYHYITNEQNVFYFKTDHNAGNYRVVSVDITDTHSPLVWNEIVSEHKRNRLADVLCVHKDLLLLNYMEDCQDTLQLVDLTGKPVKHSIAFPSAGTIVFTGRKTSNEAFFRFTSFLYPGIIYLYDFHHHSMKILFEIKVPNFDASQFVTNQVSMCLLYIYYYYCYLFI
ncbi:prolyl oligopeptidase / prolyl endopeptidase / post-proline cleaving enzyme [Reticulomyxa filosa]|uniref:Prolyl oligopeptidase / prolyl endopeptidase / post-proline cleaving enzyme n=1 Tax=Reticulomyxa filosa TaxID=46433 RepID=X6LXU7_RETFI|nr:prolyl oligopeptidase / prolyl endopeptidase / post-proline cleaving enzyme [Reticulomyxa filosa]|eukprot:ETO05962.1 prolyl oligopeptidase / prolyl endopeptidase / post-proline cleaving enzyme [Reticulomyxa filosa]